MKTSIFIAFLISGSVFSQSLSVEKLSNCLIEKCDETSFFKENNFQMVYGGPRKMGGYISLFKNKSKQEYMFSYADDTSQTTSFTYYLPTKTAYESFLKQKVSGIDTNGHGRVYYEDGKKYYQIRMGKKQSFEN